MYSREAFELWRLLPFGLEGDFIGVAYEKGYEVGKAIDQEDDGDPEANAIDLIKHRRRSGGLRWI